MKNDAFLNNIDDPRAFDGEGRRAVVIGSGFGGLASAIRLSVRGWHVQVLERLDKPGGRARVHEQDGFRFDAGPTIVTMPQLLEDLWAAAGQRLSDDVQLVSLDPFYRVRFDDGTHFDYNGDPERMRAEVARFNPADVAGYEAFLRQAAVCYHEGLETLGAKAFDTFGDLLMAVPHLIRMRGWRSIWQMVCRYIQHPKLRIVFSFHPLLIGGNPLDVSCSYALINILERRFGVHWAMGGTGSLVTGMVRLLSQRGVPVRLNCDVKRITVEKGRATGVDVQTERGLEHIDADIVVSNADTAWTYRHLVEPQHRRTWTNAKIERQHYSMGLFVWYFGTDKRFDDVPHHQMVLGPRYEGLLQDMFNHHKLTEDFSLYLHRPTATDRSMAPDGCDAFYALVPVPHLDSGTDWARVSLGYQRRVLERLESTVLPGLGRHVVSSRIATPQHFHDDLLSFKGAGFGMEPRLLQSAWFRPHNRSEDVKGLFVVGASTHPGAGVPGVLLSAVALESVLPDLPALTFPTRPRPATA